VDEVGAGRPLQNDPLTWNVTSWLGVVQVIAALFPGTSRSATTFFAAMLAGMTSRPAAAEFAIIVGIPTMFAATAYELMAMYADRKAGEENWIDLGVGFVVSAIVAFIAVKWLLQDRKSVV